MQRWHAHAVLYDTPYRISFDDDWSRKLISERPCGSAYTMMALHCW